MSPTWGTVLVHHRIGDFDVIEYRPHRPDNVDMADWDPTQVNFQTYVSGESTGHSWRTLNAALIHCIVWQEEKARDGDPHNERITELVMRLFRNNLE